MFLQKFDEWKQSLPDFKWINDIMPDDSRIDQFGRKMIDLRDKLTTDNRFFSNVSDSFFGSVDTFSAWLDEAREARRRELESKGKLKLDN
jgi:hypothetical protein